MVALGVIIFGSVWFFTIKNQIETESNRLVSVQSDWVLDFKKPRKPICSYFFSNSPVRCLFTTIVFPALCKRIKSKKSTPLISSQIQNSVINQNPKFSGTGNLDFHRSHWNWALHYSTQNAESWRKQASKAIISLDCCLKCKAETNWKISILLTQTNLPMVHWKNY